MRATRPLAVKRIGILCKTAASAAHVIQVGIYDSSGNRVANSDLSTTTLYTTNTGSTTTDLLSTGQKWLALTSTYTLTAGSVYYIAIAYAWTSGTTGAAISYYNMNDPIQGQMFGTALGTSECGYSQSVGTLPSTMASGGTSSAQPFFALSTA